MVLSSRTQGTLSKQTAIEVSRLPTIYNVQSVVMRAAGSVYVIRCGQGQRFVVMQILYCKTAAQGAVAYYMDLCYGRVLIPSCVNFQLI